MVIIIAGFYPKIEKWLHLILANKIKMAFKMTYNVDQKYKIVPRKYAKNGANFKIKILLIFVPLPFLKLLFK